MKTTPPKHKYTIEQVIENPAGTVRPVRPEDLYIDNNRGVKEAFNLLYQWQRQKERYADRKQVRNNKQNSSTTYQK